MVSGVNQKCGMRTRLSVLLLALITAAGLTTGRGAYPALGRDQAADEHSRHFEAWSVPRGRRVVVNVPGDVSTLRRALEAIAAWEIPPTASVVIAMGPGTHAMAGRVEFDHPGGARLSIVGGSGSADPTVLRWAKAPAGLYVGRGCVLGEIEGIGLELADKKARGQESGVLADEGGHVGCGAAVSVRGFYYGFTARRNGTIRCDGSRVEGAGDAGYFAYMGGHIDAVRSGSAGASDEGNSLGSGYVAEYGGSIDAAGAEASGSFLAGFHALSSGSIRAEGSRSFENAGHGYQVRSGGAIVAHRGLARGNGGFGMKNWGGGGHFEGDGLSTHDNRLGPVSTESSGVKIGPP